MKLIIQPTPEACGQACIDKYYDPEFGLIDGEYTYGKITSFLGIYK